MFAILVDITRCVGCERCVDACVKAKGFDSDRAEDDRATTRDGLSAHRLTTVLKVEPGRFAKKNCMHCLEPSCEAACLVGGITKLPEGPVVYDPDKCIGCRYCMLACPFHIPRYEWEKTVPFMQKCDLCYERIQQGELPACVEACPNRVLQFGERKTLLRIARDRIKSNPQRYLQKIYGEKEFGGTCLLYISDVDLHELGWPEEAVPIPEITEPLISKTPIIGFSVAGSLLGLNWIIRRRDKLMKETAKSKSENCSGAKEGKSNDR